ncbi:MAG: AI-2E family transporter [Opitutales bacterium]
MKPGTDRQPASSGGWLGRVAGAIVLLLLVAMLILAIDILLLFFAGGVLAVYLVWLRERLEKHLRLPRMAAFALTVLGFFGGILLLFLLMLPALTEQVALFWTKLPESLSALRGWLADRSWGSVVLDRLPQDTAWIDWLETHAADIAGRIGGIFSTTLGGLTGVGLVAVSAIFLTAEPELYRNGLLALIPERRHARAQEVLAALGRVLRGWMVGQLVSMTVLATTVGLLLWLLDVPLALLLALFTALMTFIPNLGPVLSGVPAVLLALTVSLPTAAIVLVAYVVIQVIEGSFLTPTVQRHVIALPPVLIILCQVLLGASVGFIGVLLAMPLVASGIVLVRMLYVEDVLGKEPPALLPAAAGESARPEHSDTPHA